MFHANLNYRGNLKARRTVSRSLVRRKGAAVLELALTLSILFSICYGLIEYGYYFYAKNTMEGAAREGCRNAIVAGATISTANTVIENQLQVANLLPTGWVLGGSGSSYTLGTGSGTTWYTITYTDSTTGNGVSNLSNMTVGDTLTVTITANWGIVGAAFRPAALIGANKNLVTASAMRKEGD